MIKVLTFVLLASVSMLLLCLGMTHLYDIGTAHAASLSDTVVPAMTADTGGFLVFITTGKYIPAVGIALVIAVQIIKLLPIAWFKTKPGGYVLGFGSAALLYLGTAWQSGSGITFGLFGAALGAGWAAAGGWEHLSDLIGWLRGAGGTPVTVETKPTIPEVVSGNIPAARLADRRGFMAGAWAALGLVVLRKGTVGHAPEFTSATLKPGIPMAQLQGEVYRVEVAAKDPDRWIAELDTKARKHVRRTAGVLGVLVLSAAVATGSLTACKTAEYAGHAVVDCTAGHKAEIAALADAFWDKIMSGGSWSNVESGAEGAGLIVGGCALAKTVQKFLLGTKSLSVEESGNARGSLELFRSKVANGSAFHTEIGDL